MLPAALKAHAAGFHVFPVARNDKIPHRFSSYRDIAGVQHGWGETATNDISRIIHFWTKVDREANIGIACKPSQLLVIDLDQAKEDWKLRGTEWAYLHEGYGPKVSGEAVWDEMVFKLVQGDDDNEDWSATYQVRTGSGGIHLYYRWPAHWPKISQASPVKGIVDVRGNGGQYGGYVLAEGSVTSSGPYHELYTGFPVALTPKWIRRLVVEKPKIVATRRAAGIQQPGAISWSGLVDAVRNAGEGNRNNALLWAARSMCSDGATENEALETLTTPALDAGLSYQETGQTIRSAYRLQQQKEGV